MDEIKFIYHSNKCLPADCELWEKGLKAMYFLYLCSVSGFIFFNKEFIFCPTDVDQPFNKHCKGITKNDLQKQQTQ